MGSKSILCFDSNVTSTFIRYRQACHLQSFRNWGRRPRSWVTITLSLSGHISTVVIVTLTFAVTTPLAFPQGLSSASPRHTNACNGWICSSQLCSIVALPKPLSNMYIYPLPTWMRALPSLLVLEQVTRMNVEYSSLPLHRLSRGSRFLGIVASNDLDNFLAFMFSHDKKTIDKVPRLPLLVPILPPCCTASLVNARYQCTVRWLFSLCCWS